MLKMWYEVNEAWAEASLVWLSSLVLNCKVSEVIELVGWCEVVAGREEWVEGYVNRCAEIIGGRFKFEVRVYEGKEYGIELGGRCIPSESVGIAISRIEHYNEMLREEEMEAIKGRHEILSSYREKDYYIHCDIDCVFTEWFDAGVLLGELEELTEDNGRCIVGVSEYEEIESVLAETHSEEFMTKLQGVYLNCGFICFHRIKRIDIDKLIEFLKGSDSYCLEQDYINSEYEKREMSVSWNMTFRSGNHLPYMVHYYGENKPFLVKPEGLYDRSYEYFGIWFRYVEGIKWILSKEFYSRCLSRYRDYLVWEGR